jgi:uncharacterized cupin superfamily protein
MTDVRDGLVIVHLDDVERTGSWRLVRRALGLRSFGVNVVEVAPGDTLPEHDEVDRDQEEIFYVISGSATLLVDGAEHPLAAGTFARLDPEHRRTVTNAGSEPALVLIASAPRSSGYEPMGWA